MKLCILIVLTMCAALTIPNQTQSEGWRGIVPLRSTRADVECILGKPIDKTGLIYDTEKERIFIHFQGERCVVSDEKGRNVQGGWNVPPETVLSIRVSLKVELLFTDFNIDETKYKKFVSPHDGTTYYSNEEAGIGIAVDSAEGRVKSFSYGPTTKDERLRCPTPPKTSAPPNTDTSPPLNAVHD